MFTHVMIGSNDIARSRAFYDAVIGTLGFAGEPMTHEAAGHTRLFYNHDGGLFAITQPLNDKAATPANGGTIGFACASPEQAQQFHDTAVAHGGTSVEDPPGWREDTGLGPMYRAYVLDPDGNKLTAIHRPNE